MQQWKVEKGVGGQKEFRRGWIKKPELSQQHEKERDSVGEEKASGQENAFFPLSTFCFGKTTFYHKQARQEEEYEIVIFFSTPLGRPFFGWMAVMPYRTSPPWLFSPYLCLRRRFRSKLI